MAEFHQTFNKDLLKDVDDDECNNEHTVVPSQENSGYDHKKG
jgi:hypothetical protein